MYSFWVRKPGGQFNDAKYDSSLELSDSVSFELDSERALEFLSVSGITGDDRGLVLSVCKVSLFG